MYVYVIMYIYFEESYFKLNPSTNVDENFFRNSVSDIVIYFVRAPV